jgi:uroporphyrinogen III methyltransferase/synthase
MSASQGTVYLLGAGPGAVAFLTVAGRALLAKAEVVIYDALIDPKLLSLTPKSCIHLLAGKRGQQPSIPQSEINQRLVQYCQEGKRVVRLKSGDPALFGRLAEEVLALQAAGCRFEVWPGLSSALAVPLLAGIPLTDATLSRIVTIASAHDLTALDWELLAHSESLVLLMGGRSLSDIVQLLQQHGRPSETPMAIIRWGGWPQQQVWTGTLATIVEETGGLPLSPAIMVIGSVVSLRPQLAIPTLPLSVASSFSFLAMSEFLPQPLTGQTILVTRAASQASDFRGALEAEGATVLEMAALEIGPPSSWAVLDEAIAQLATFHWLILTSANGVDYFFERLQSQGKDARALAGINIAVVGRKTAASLKAWGLKPDFVPPNYVADDLVTHFPDAERLPRLRCLFPRVESGGRDVLVQEFQAKGATMIEAPAYQSQCPKAVEPQVLAALQHQKVDIVTFASSKTVTYFWQLLQQTAPDLDWHHLLQPVKIASIGPQTSQTCQTYFGRVDIEAQTYTLEGLIQSILANTGTQREPN